MSVDSPDDPWGADPARAHPPDTAVLEVVARVVVQRHAIDEVGAYVTRELRALAEKPANPNVRIHWEDAGVPEAGTAGGLVRSADGPRLRILVPSRVVLRDGEPLTLTRLEFDLLLFLAENPGRVHRRGSLLRLVWGIESALSTRTVDVHVRRLRGKCGPELDFITTIRGVGYRFDGADHVGIDYGTEDSGGHRWLAAGSNNRALPTG
ncbi:winged helix-turn-helix transcriptional regulator [Saccharopolyspora erythraea]|uniref:winged helix-turn-helix domain-containing protein n=1 Tax=Saccharopolyspora erythraea TaxID=1836 RepID=UPI001BA5EC80|nr:winged helix-turn-helix domain-containing protein [Saccharopolyspora erythraea]QUH02630.1 winged helix-turn-helix transcriptional regulator [Saccharopolyspora erythraea]